MNIKIRSAAKEDSLNIYRLSSQGDVRSVSVHRESITWEEHVQWFSSAINDLDTLFFVIETTQSFEFVGQLRYKLEQAIATVSISIDSSFRGKGYGADALQIGDRMVFDTKPEILEIQAIIQDANQSSTKTFTRVGYVQEGFRSISGRKFQLYSRKRISKMGNSSRVLMVAELSANHNQKLDIALESVRAAKEAGADAIKIQTYLPETITIDCDNEYFKIKQGTPWDGKTLYQLYKEAYTPWEWHAQIKEEADKAGLQIFSTPFDKTAVDFLEKLKMPMYKVASFEITDIPLIEYIAAKGKPIILSTGISTLAEIEEAVTACRRQGNNNITVLKCLSEYPALPEHANLLTIPNLRETFNVCVGISDHTLGITVPVAAAALGARLIEKHFILRRSLGGPDCAFSLEPSEFRQMTDAVRTVEKALGRVTYELSESASRNRELSRSLFVVDDIAAGEEFTTNNVRSIRPGYGLHPRYMAEVLGRRARKKIARGTPLSWGLIG